ncbi:hypothetical protein PHLCEN_2v4407 [Hermanssonia centrifuga]|uniref:Uncharacterized protein n=1 Tax=Hermanssonia centrifuga TaxID=98765 RepID=A0A2R6PNN5_9APHY|nr:hypothetical protein PHLCEN_2v4407 [Hermanssonia centrifuga]
MVQFTLIAAALLATALGAQAAQNQLQQVRGVPFVYYTTFDLLNHWDQVTADIGPNPNNVGMNCE